MGRKIEMKKIENLTKCQVTFSKRRKSLMKKAHEISACCDAEVAFVTFSPSGRVSKFCSQRRIEDVIHRYLSLPVDRRYTIAPWLLISSKWSIVQEKLRQLDNIKGDNSKLMYLDKQIENLELQIRKSTLQSQILETRLGDFEPLAEQHPSQHQLLWCERNLKQSLERVVARKNALIGKHPSSKSHPSVQVGLENQRGTPNEFEEKCPSLVPENSSAGELMMQLDPWISPYSSKVRESIIQGLLEQSNRTRISIQSPAGQNHINKQDPAIPMPRSNSNTEHVNCFPSDNHVIYHTNPERTIPSAVDGPLFTASASTPKGLDFESLRSLQTQVGLDQCQAENYTMINEPMFLNQKPTLTQHKNVKQTNEPNSQNIQSSNNNNNGNNRSKVLEASLFRSLPLEQDNVEDNNMWTKDLQESGLWEWDDLVMVDNMNLDDLENFF